MRSPRSTLLGLLVLGLLTQALPAHAARAVVKDQRPATAGRKPGGLLARVIPGRLTGAIKPTDKAQPDTMKLKARPASGRAKKAGFALQSPEMSIASAMRHEADHGGKATFGDRMADKVVQKIGNWKFLGGYFAAVAGWIGFNTLSPHAFDGPPFVGLITALSILAIPPVSILLMSEKRQGMKDRARFEMDLAADLHTKEKVDALHAKIDTLTTLAASQQKSLDALLAAQQKPAAMAAAK